MQNIAVGNLNDFYFQEEDYLNSRAFPLNNILNITRTYD